MIDGTGTGTGTGTALAAPDGSDAALSAPRTAASLRRLTRLAWGVLLVGLAATAALALSFAADLRADADLRATGVHADGTVLHVDPDSKGSPGGARVSWGGSGADRTEYVVLGSDAGHYESGQQVEVIYDPHDLSRITLDDVPWTPPGADAAEGLLLLPAGLGLLIGSLLVWIRSRTRHLLAGRVWTPVRVEVVRTRGRLFLTGVDAWQSDVVGRWPRPDDAGEQDAWWVSDGRRAVFSPDQGGPLVLAKRSA